MELLAVQTITSVNLKHMSATLARPASIRKVLISATAKRASLGMVLLAEMPTNVSAIMVVVTHMLLASISQDRIGVCVKKDSKAMASHVLTWMNAP